MIYELVMSCNLFDDENCVFDELSLQHWMKNTEECLEVRLAISERYDDGDSLASDAPSWRPMTANISAEMWE